MKTFLRLRRFSGGDAQIGTATTDVIQASKIEDDMQDGFDQIQVFNDGELIDTYVWSAELSLWVNENLKPFLSDINIPSAPIEVTARQLREDDVFHMAGTNYKVWSSYYVDGDSFRRIVFAKVDDYMLMSMDIPSNLTFTLVERP